MGAAIKTNHRDIISVRHKKRHFCSVIMHTMQEKRERKVWATPLFVFLSLVDSPFSRDRFSQTDLSSFERHKRNG